MVMPNRKIYSVLSIFSDEKQKSFLSLEGCTALPAFTGRNRLLDNVSVMKINDASALVDGGRELYDTWNYKFKKSVASF